MRILYLTALLGMLSYVTIAQSLRAYEKAGDEAMAKHEYYNAVHYYEQVLKSKQESSIQYRYAEACRLSFDYQKAEEYYQKVLRSRDQAMYPLLGFHYATVLKHNAKYDQAGQEFTRFAQGYPTDNFYRKKAFQEAKSCYVAKELAKKPIDTLAIERLGDQINTEFSDFGGHYVGDTFYYSSLRFAFKPAKNTKKAIEDANKRLVSKLLTSPNPKDKKAELLPTLNVDNQHTSNTALSVDGKRLYFTYCAGERSDSIECAIYVAYRQNDGSWGSPRRLPPSINHAKCTNTQPTIGWDSLRKKEILFFASNRPGGQGDLDIWYTTIQKDSIYGEVLNAGTPINTIDAEGTPYFHTPTQTLYFSSRWHEGMGGYDIFKTYREAGNHLWVQPQNMGVPVNSAANDLYFIINENDTTGFFASNRSGSMAITGESCCNDIYAYTILTKKTPVVTTITKIDTPVIARVDPPKTTTKVDTPSTSVVTTTTTTTTTPNTNVVTTTNTNTTTTPNTNVVTTTTTNTNTNTTGTKTTPSETDIAKKIEELNEMLPLRLYFHNDEPDSNTTSKHTDKPYELPYRHYISLQEQYIQQHSAQFGVEMQPMKMAEVRNFFEEDVKGEYNRMNAFFDKLLELLDAGVKLEIYIKGYTSPRSPEGYNLALAQRRITSVRKQLFIYKKGIFMQHFQSGAFWVHEVPLGESTAPKGISDEIDDPANSIYAVDASKERRAEIIVLRRK